MDWPKFEASLITLPVTGIELVGFEIGCFYLFV